MNALARRDLLLGILFRPRTAEIAGVRFRIVRNGPERRYFFWVHGNEKTAGEVLLKHMRTATGRALMTPSDERNILILDGQIDPNRMFSRAGAEKNLRTLNPSWEQARINRALAILDSDRGSFLRALLPDGDKLLVALHNNGPNYSVNDEVAISDAVALNARSQPDEFMLFTMREDYEIAAKSSFNALLQHKAPPEDDGSLSRLAALRGIRYVNIEAAHGNSAAQTRMLEWVERNLR